MPNTAGFQFVFVMLIVACGLAECIAQTEQPDLAAIRTEVSTVNGLEEIVVELEAGVVTLRGEVPALADIQRAEKIVSSMAGVDVVENQLTLSPELGDRVEQASERLNERVHMLWRFLPLVLLALAIIVFFVFLAQLVGRLRGLFSRFTDNVFLADLLRQAAQAFMVLLGVLLALDLLDLTAVVGAVIGAAGIFGIAVGFAFRDVIENYLASILLSLRQPFALNDHVLITGHEGKVARLNSRATILMDFDGNHIRIPNANVFKATIVNFSRNPLRRFEFTVGAGTDVPLSQALDLAQQTLGDISSIQEHPAPLAVIESLGDSNVSIKIMGWVDQSASDFLKTRSEAIRLVKKAFDEAGIGMPEPTFNLKVRNFDVDTEDQVSVSVTLDEDAQLRDTGAEDVINQQIEQTEQGEQNLLDKGQVAE